MLSLEPMVFEFQSVRLAVPEPSAGPVSGGTVVSIAGINAQFSPPGSPVICVFGADTQTASTLSGVDSLTCVTPAVSSAQATSIQLVCGNATCGTPLGFSYYDDPAVLTVGPTVGPTRGGTPVRVELHRMADFHHLFCRFGTSLQALSRRRSSFVIECVAPPHPTGVIDLRLSLDGQQYHHTVAFTVYDDPVVSLTPTYSPTAGSTVIRVHGLPAHTAAWCRFGHTLGAAAIQAGNTACIAPLHEEGFVSVAASINVYDFTDAAIPIPPIRYLGSSVEHVLPSMGPISGGTMLDIAATKLSPIETICMFDGDVATHATFIHSGLARCTSPVYKSAVLASVNLVADGSIVPGTVFFRYHWPVSVSGISPSSGPAAGGTVVAVAGGYFPSTKIAYCNFAGRSVVAMYIDAESLECVSPPSDHSDIVGPLVSPSPDSLSTASFEVTLNDREYTDDGHAFEYKPALRVVHVVPLHGPQQGNTLVEIVAHGLVQSSTVCRFAGKVVPASLTDSMHAKCVAPASQSTGFVSLHISTNLQDFFASGLFRYRDTGLIRATPTSGPRRGGTVISIEGRALSPWRMFCSIAPGHVQPAFFVSASRASCTLPEAPAAGAALVMLGAAGAEFSGQVVFDYLPEVRVHGLSPPHGPLLGGTIIAVAVEEPIDGHTFTCRFASSSMLQVVIARKVNDHAVECTSPTSPLPDHVTVEIAVNSHEFGSSLPQHEFAFHSDNLIQQISPAHGPVAGGTEVVLEGSFYPDRRASLSYVICSFNGTHGVPVSLSASQLVCTAPLHASGLVDVEVSTNGQDFTRAGVQFQFINQHVSHAVPSHGPLSGATTVMLTGADIGLLSGAFCHFAQHVAPASMVSLHALSCVSPPISTPARVEIGLSSLGAQISSTATFRYTETVTIAGIQPLFGPRAGGTCVTISGSEFPEFSTALTCAFGDKRVPAQLVSSFKLECYAPPGAGDVLVSISADGVDFVHANSTFVYASMKHVLSLEPFHGPAAGGTIVTLGFEHTIAPRTVPALSCFFGASSRPASVTSAFEVRCLSPPHVAGIVDVELRSAVETYTETSLEYRYLDAHAIVARPTEGPMSGGTSVVVAGLEAVSPTTAGVTCLFGNASTEATVEEPSRVWCVSPPYVEMATIALSVMDLEGTPLSGDLSFEYVAPVVPKRLLPLMGPTSGGTRVTLVVAEMPASPRVYCKFGQAELTLGRWVGTSSLQCTSPQSSKGSRNFAVVLEHGEIVSTDFSFEYFEDALVHGVEPSCGPMHGGTTLTIVGASFSRRALELEYMFCRLGDVFVAATYLSDTLVECATPPGNAGYVSIEVGNEDADTTPGGVLFQYQAVGTWRLTPPAGPISGGTLIFLETDKTCASRVQCAFDDLEPVPAMHVASDVFGCVSPPQIRGRHVALRVRADGAWEGAALSFQYFEDAIVSAVHPPTGPLQGGTQIEVRGTNFVPSAHLLCMVAGVRVVGVWISHHRISCTTPPHEAAGNVSLAVANDGHTTLGPHVDFEFGAEPVASDLSPAAGPRVGGTLLTIFGSGFMERAAALGLLACRFNLSTVAASYLTNESISCAVPRMKSVPRYDGAALVSHVSVSNNWQDFSASPLRYTYRAHPVLESVSPLIGPTKGGTVIHVRGEDLEGTDMSCSFDEVRVEATYVTSAWIQCATPEYAGAFAAQLAVVLDDYAVGALVFTYQSVPEVLSLSPAEGPEGGRNVVYVYGSEFVNTPALSCLFGGIMVPAEFMASTMIRCTAPSHSGGSVELGVTNDGVHFAESRPVYVFKATVHVATMLPTRGPAAGGTNVTILGRNLDNARCRFGEYYSPKTWIISPNEILCTTPELPFGTTSVRVSVSSDAVHGEFRVAPAPAIASISPTGGPEVGGTAVDVFGDHFEATCACLFGDEPPVPATLISRVQLQCVTPAVSAQHAGFALMCSRMVYRRSDVKFMFYAEVELEALYPSHGPTGGATHITIQGSFPWSRDVKVRFFDTDVDAIVSNSTAIECRTQPHAAGQVTVQVSLNGVDFSSQRLFFVFEQTNVVAVYPTSGPEYGGTTVQIEGSAFTMGTSLQCAFGTHALSRPVWVSTSRIECMTPAAPLGKVDLAFLLPDCPLEVATAFEYQAAVRVSAVHPPVGFTAGGTRVAVSGAHFSSRSADLMLLQCRFNMTRVRATLVDSNNVWCTSPNHRVQSEQGLSFAAGVPVEVSQPAPLLACAVPHSTTSPPRAGYQQHCGLQHRLGQVRVLRGDARVGCDAPARPAGWAHVGHGQRRQLHAHGRLVVRIWFGLHQRDDALAESDLVRGAGKGHCRRGVALCLRQRPGGRACTGDVRLRRAPYSAVRLTCEWSSPRRHLRRRHGRGVC